MKVVKILLAACLLPASAFACGNPAETQKDPQQQLLSEISRKPLACEANGQQSDGLVETWAMYRCIGSPIYGELSVFGEKAKVTEVTKEGGKYHLKTEKSAAIVTCVVKS